MAQLQATGISGSLTVTSGSVTELFVTNTGVRLGNIITDTHTVTGSLSISGSLNATSSWATNVVSASYALSASHAITASFVRNASSASYAVSASNALTASVAFSASNAFSASYSVTASHALNAGAAAAPPSLIFSGSVTASVDVTPTQVFRLLSGSSTFMQVNNAGSIGIGTTSPDARLRVAGAMNATHSIFGNVDGRGLAIQTVLVAGTNEAGSILNSRGVGSGTLIFQTDGTERVRIAADGNVGIGTTTPTTGKLQINTSAANNNAITIQATSQTAITYGIGIDASSNFAIYDNFSAAQRITMNGSGNVGIGTTVPNYKLEVVNSTGTLGLRLVTSASTVGNPQIDIFDSTRSQETVISSTDGTTVGTYIASFSNHPLLFGTNAGSFPTARMVIQGDGKVGIGTTTPSGLLDVFGLTRVITPTSGFLVYTSGSDFTQGIRIGDLSTDNGFMYLAYISASRVGSIQPGDNITYRNLALNHQGGNVGIGFISPTGVTAKLHISASTNPILRIESQDNSDTNPTVYIEGNKGGSSPFTSTLIELKSNADVRGRGIHLSAVGTTAEWFAGVPYLGAGYQIGYAASSGLPFVVESSSLFIDTNGNIGIGLSNPNNKLVVNGAIGFASASIITPFADRSGNYTRILEPGTGIAIYLGNATDPGNYYDNTNHYFRNRGGGTTYAIITSAGSIGIGTTAPAVDVHVSKSQNGTVGFRAHNTNAGSSAFSALQLGQQFGANEAAQRFLNIGFASNGVTEQGVFVPTGSFIISYGNGGLNFLATGSNAHIRFFTSGSNSGGTERIRITSGGNTGIGTPSPEATLHVSGNTAINTPILEVETGANLIGLYVSSSTGNVGIGTSQPGRGIPTTIGAFLDVSGSIRAAISIILPVTGALPTNLPTGAIMSSGSGANARPYYWNGIWRALF